MSAVTEGLEGAATRDGTALDDRSRGPSPPPRAVAADRRYWVLVLLPLVAGFGLRLGLALGDDVVTNDSTAYLGSGRNLIEGRGFTRQDGTPELHFPPATPLVMGVAWKVTGSPLGAVAGTTLVASTLALLPLAALGRRLAGDRGGIAAAWVGALAGGTSAVPAVAGGGSEALFLLLLLTGAWLVATLPDRRGRARTVAAGVAGLAGGLLYLTRPEGLFAALVLLAGAVLCGGVDSPRAAGDRRWSRVRTAVGTVRERPGPAVAFAVALLVCVVPYVAFLHSHTGRWELSAKTRDADIAAWRAVAEGDRRARDAILHELDDSGLRLVERSSSLPSLARSEPGAYLGIVRVNARELAKAYAVPVTFAHRPIPIWAHLPLPLTVLAAWAAWRLRRHPATPLLVALAGCSLAIALGFFMQPRYLVPATGALCVLAGAGLALLVPPWRRLAHLGAIVLLVVPLFQDAGRRGGFFDPYEPVEHALAGEWIAEHTPRDSRIMTRSLVTAFHSERETVSMPYASVEQTVRFARHHGVEYLVVDQFLLRRFRPQLRPLLQEGPWPGLRVVHQMRHRRRLTRIFALDPPPARDSVDPPRLGYVGDS